MTDSRGEMALDKEVKSVKWPVVLPCGLISELEQPIFSSDSDDRDWECHGVPHFQTNSNGSSPFNIGSLSIGHVQSACDDEDIKQMGRFTNKRATFFEHNICGKATAINLNLHLRIVSTTISAEMGDDDYYHVFQNWSLFNIFRYFGAKKPF